LVGSEQSLKTGLTAYCAGAGEDITFDLALLERGLKVTVFDPTPRAIEYVNKTAPQDENFRLVTVGWWDKGETLRFYAPRDDSHVSHSVVNLQRTEKFFEAKVSPVCDPTSDTFWGWVTARGVDLWVRSLSASNLCTKSGSVGC
jgi:hypothetical protein